MGLIEEDSFTYWISHSFIFIYNYVLGINWMNKVKNRLVNYSSIKLKKRTVCNYHDTFIMVVLSHQ